MIIIVLKVITALEFLISELKSHNSELITKNGGREGVDFLIRNHQIHLQLQLIDLNTVKQSIKITTQDLGGSTITCLSL